MSHQKSFPELLSEVVIQESSNTTSVAVDEVVLSSKNATVGKVFLAMPGILTDGRLYIDSALENGASAVIAEAKNITIRQMQSLENSSRPWVLINNISQKLAKIAEIFYGNVTDNMDLVGITGTNGKTSICQMAAEIIRNIEGVCGQMGTLGNGLSGELEETINTTSDPLTIRKVLKRISAANAQHTLMEVSSHALEQNRVDQLDFKVAVFTNLSRDHLDFHGSMEAYAAAKKKLFTSSSVKFAVINADDEFGQRLLADKDISAQKIAYSINSKNLNQLPKSIWPLEISNVKLQQTTQKCQIKTPWGEAILNIPLIGEFNLSNTLAVVAILGCLDFSWHQILMEIEILNPVPGRMEIFGGGTQPLIVVDYAHTPDALKKSLQALKKHCLGTLYCVFGCGGDRDIGKRPLMGSAAEKYADKIIITDDNPRNENGNAIISGILTGLKQPGEVIIERDRVQAIINTLATAKTGDTVLIAGKGHENFQYIGGCKLPHSDRKLVISILQEAA